jgi:DNA mismatch repair ATPase MutS
VLAAEALGHPLIADDVRVANDVSVGPPGTLLLVTGSNMSGKSTLLRAIGANAILAQAGGPVCASRLTMPLLAVEASVRTSDSLERGISLFMAELERIKRIVDAARRSSLADGKTPRPVLYLLDEMLHGTNSVERRIAARVVLGHLLRAGAIGVVTTQDLALASEGALAQAARPVHFTESFRRSESVATMTFDYKLRPGLATSANALKLLELVGLGE